jgi:mannose-6-phosphate isomerase
MAPLRFEPIYMQRVWGGRRLESLLGRRLPLSARIGESWEVVDREDAQSVVHEGPLRGLTLHELWTQHRDAVFGPGLPDAPRFPLLCKILDAQDRLSVQVHPPAAVAAQLAGEPKTEMWYILETQPGSTIYAGLKEGVTRAAFEQALAEGRVAETIHTLPTHAGDTIFIPSGRVHAIGSGNLIVEVQQNSDTTYRVFDWNRLGLDGKPRGLHVAESLASINFADAEPQFAVPNGETLVECPFFRVESWTLDAPRRDPGPGFALFTVVAGTVECGGEQFPRGSFFLLPADCDDRELRPFPLESGATVLRTTLGCPKRKLDDSVLER